MNKIRIAALQDRVDMCSRNIALLTDKLYNPSFEGSFDGILNSINYQQGIVDGVQPIINLLTKWRV